MIFNVTFKDLEFFFFSDYPPWIRIRMDIYRNPYLYPHKTSVAEPQPVGAEVFGWSRFCEKQNNVKMFMFDCILYIFLYNKQHLSTLPTVKYNTR